MVAWLSGFFGALALLLAGLGLYGVTSYAVSRRRTEIGIRLALGAPARGVVRLVLSRVALLVGLGIVAGAAVSMWLSKFVATLALRSSAARSRHAGRRRAHAGRRRRDCGLAAGPPRVADRSPRSPAEQLMADRQTRGPCRLCGYPVGPAAARRAGSNASRARGPAEVVEDAEGGAGRARSWTSSLRSPPWATWPERQVAFELLESHAGAFAMLNAARVEALAQGLADWASVDFRRDRRRSRLARRPHLGCGRFTRWTKSPDRWRRRLALVATVRLNTPARGKTGDASADAGGLPAPDLRPRRHGRQGDVVGVEGAGEARPCRGQTRF